MELIKIMVNGRPQGVYGLTKKEDVTDALLDEMNKDKEDKEFTKAMLKMHLEKGLSFIPVGEKAFDWDEEIHGKF